MPTFVGFNTFAALPEEQISEKISRRILAGNQGMLVWWGPASMLSRTVTQMNKSRGCSRASGGVPQRPWGSRLRGRT